MENSERLKSARNILLKLHKLLLDDSRTIYEAVNGPVSPANFLQLLLEDPQFAWLRKFSTLIVEIDEMFDQKDGFDPESVNIHLDQIRKLLSLDSDDLNFITSFESGLHRNSTAEDLVQEIKAIL